MNTLILGIGNLLLKDEGVGIHVIQKLQKEKLPNHVELMDGGTGGFHLLSFIENYDHIIMVDATLDNNPPGTVRILEPKYASDFPPLMSAHEIGLKDMIEAMVLSDSLPKIHLIVISVVDVSEVGMELNAVVQKAIPKAIQSIKKLIE